MKSEVGMFLAGPRLCQKGCRLQGSSLRAVVRSFVRGVVGHSNIEGDHSAPLRDVYAYAYAYACMCVSIGLAMRQRCDGLWEKAFSGSSWEDDGLENIGSRAR